MNFQRCSKCLIPNTRPDTEFVNGVCSACVSYANRPHIDWDARKAELLEFRDRARPVRDKTGFDCIVPSSGGKDSTYQVITLLELGFHPLIVTATTCMLTPIGGANIDNLARYATTIEVTPNKTVRAKLNRLGLEMVGDISWPEHSAIFTIPFRIASARGIKILFYGENPQNQYGGPNGTENANALTRRWRSEFGGFLGLRPQDVVGQHGITAEDMIDYQMPPESDVEVAGIEAHFLGYYLPWDSEHNAKVAKKHGMKQELPCDANLWDYENLDNAMTGLHDFMCYLKYGYGRACAQVSVEIRKGAITREQGLSIVKTLDGKFPNMYAGVHISDVLRHIGLSAEELGGIIARFKNTELFDAEHRSDLRPILREFSQ